MYRSISKAATTLLLACLLIAILLVGCSPKTVSGNEWLRIQEQCLSDLQTFADGMDEIYSLYFIGAISSADFYQELKVLKQQYGALLLFYNDLKEDNPVREGSHTYVSKKGTEGIEDCYRILGEIIKNSVGENGKPLGQGELSYIYLAYKQRLTSSISTYVTAMLWLDEASQETAA